VFVSAVNCGVTKQKNEAMRESLLMFMLVLVFFIPKKLCFGLLLGFVFQIGSKKYLED
jgi:hypothetical protein